MDVGLRQVALLKGTHGWPIVEVMPAPTARPLLSASLIVKDEEAMLPRCLAALADVVDEIVVLDTGSSDRTVEIAEAAGAIVHRSGWADDFALARNESLAHCRGRWVIYVDADEALQVDDVAAFRRELARTTADAYTVRIENVEDHGGAVAFTHEPTRLFRRSRFTFEGRIHEHVVPRTDRLPDVRRADALSIRHYGYVPEVVAAKDKVGRNTRLAEAAWAMAPDDVLARIELARSLSSTDRHEETMAHVRALLEEGGATRHTALNLGLKVLVNAGDAEEVLRWAETIREEGADTTESTKLHAEVLFGLGRYEDALEVIETAPDAPDAGVHGTFATTTATDVLRGRLLHILGREDEAVDLFVSLAAAGPDSLWPQLVEVLSRRGELERAVTPFFDGLEQLGEGRARGVLSALSCGPLDAADAFFGVLAADPRGLAFALAFALANAERLSTERAAAWSGVARAAGLEANCALVQQMRSPVLAPMARFTAAAMVVGTYGDERARPILAQTAGQLFVEELPEALYVVSELAPEAFLDLVTGFVRSQRRALALADALMGLGASAEAIAVLEFGQESCPADPQAAEEIAAALAHLVAL